jgi:hypothetical protein
MKTMQKASLPILLIAGALLSPAFASAGADVGVDTPPPAPRVERVSHREGYVWTPGYWEWTGHFYQWVSGTYVYERRGHQWVAGHWDQIGSQWHYTRGHWEQPTASYNARTSP